MAPCSLAQSQLKELLHYDPDTGIFTHILPRRGVSVGAEAGTIDVYGYRTIQVNKKKYRSHRLAWLYIYGVWPKDQIDHVNQIKIDNRVCNLREVTNSQNCQNVGLRITNTSGVKGVCWVNSRCKWQAQIKLNNKQNFLGHFKSLADAVAARKQAEEQLHSHRVVA